MIKLEWKQGSTKLNILLPSDDYVTIPVSCVVRNLTNGNRYKDQVVTTIPDDKPYNPDIFPKGSWLVGRPLPRTDKYKAPYFIPSDAFTKVNVWNLDSSGNYDHETKKTVIDRAYGLHYSNSRTTLGCIKIEKESDLLLLANIIFEELRQGEICQLDIL